MLDKFFGTYLLNKGVFDGDALQKILDYMKNAHVKIGTMAIKEEMMSGVQVEEITLLQKSVDKKFGELALEKGYLNETQLNTLLNKQSEESNLQLGQAAIDLGFLTYKQLDEEMKNFQTESGLSDKQLEALKNGEQEQIVKELFHFDYPVFYDYVSLFLRNILRFLDRQPWLDFKEQGDTKKDGKETITAYQYLHNDEEILTAISMDIDTFKLFAGEFAKMPVDKDEKLAEASVTEFLNLHNGIFNVNMSNQGIILQLNPPEIKKGKANELIQGNAESYCIDINTGLGKIKLLLAK